MPGPAAAGVDRTGAGGGPLIPAGGTDAGVDGARVAGVVTDCETGADAGAWTGSADGTGRNGTSRAPVVLSFR